MRRFGDKIARAVATQATNALFGHDKRGRRIRKQKKPGCLSAVVSFFSVILMGMFLVFAIVKFK